MRKKVRMNAGEQNRTSAMAAPKVKKRNRKTHGDLEEIRSDVANCHPHPIGIEAINSGHKNRRMDHKQRVGERTAEDVRESRSASPPERLTPPH